MRIVETTPSRVILRHRTVWGALLLLIGGGLALLSAADNLRLATPWLGLLLAAAGLVLMRSNKVTFDAERRICTLSRLTLLRLRRRELAFDEITDLSIEPSRRKGGIAAMCCRFSLVTDREVIPLMETYEPGPERYRIMREEVLGLVFGEAQTALR